MLAAMHIIFTSKLGIKGIKIALFNVVALFVYYHCRLQSLMSSQLTEAIAMGSSGDKDVYL